MGDTWEHRKKGIGTYLERWEGGDARIWEFVASHRQLVVRVEKTEQFGNLHLICMDLEFIHGPARWSNCSFQIEVQLDQNSQESTYILKDENADFQARAGAIEVKENCKPVFRRSEGDAL